MKKAVINNKRIDTKEIQKLIIEGDTIDSVSFILPRYHNGTDLSSYDIYLKYENDSGLGESLLLTSTFNDKHITAIWEVKGGFVQSKGQHQIQLWCSEVVNGQTVMKWQTQPARVEVIYALNPTPMVIATPTILEEYLALYQAQSINYVIDGTRVGFRKGPSGAWSYTDDLKGERGLQGLKGDKGDTGLQGIQGIKGDKGDTGDISNLDVAPVAFTENSTLSNINTGETVATLFGKLKKLFTDTLAHFTDNVKHITSAERSNWNGKANATDLTSHTGDDVKHITASERTTWNAKLDSFTETDPTVSSWAKAASKPTYAKSEVGLGNVDDVKQYSASNPPPYPVTSVNAKTGAVVLGASDVGALPNDTVIPAKNLWYGVATSMPTNVLIVSCEGYTLSVGSIIAIFIPNQAGLRNNSVGIINVNNTGNITVSASRQEVADGSGFYMYMYDGTYYQALTTTYAKNAYQAFKLEYGCQVTNGGTGLESLTSGSYLVGNGTSAINLKTPAQVLADILAAPLASPALTGTPTAPTAVAGTNTTQIATTAFVKAAATSAVNAITFPVTKVNNKTGAVNLTTSDITEGTNQYYTESRFDAAFATKSSSDLSNGSKIATTDDVLILNGGNANGN